MKEIEYVAQAVKISSLEGVLSPPIVFVETVMIYFYLWNFEINHACFSAVITCLFLVPLISYSHKLYLLRVGLGYIYNEGGE